jgi:ATP-dependent Clp protease ATP-binding subunit ClpA
MFERFTQRARQVIVLAQEEARLLKHNYIGTEHLLLGMLSEAGGVGARALDAAGLTLAEARKQVEESVGRGKAKPSGHIPFTPRAKKVLELSLREALSLGHNYIGTEHLLLGLIREGEGLGGQVIFRAGIDFDALRQAVIALVPPGEQSSRRRRWLRGSRGQTIELGPDDDLRTTQATDVSLDVARRLAGNAAVGSHHLLLAAISDSSSAASKALSSMGLDLDRAREALKHVDIAGTSDELPEEAGRRRMRLRVGADVLTLETDDPALLMHANAAVAALGMAVGADGVISGDSDVASSLGDVWQALSGSLLEITARARAQAELHADEAEHVVEHDEHDEPDDQDDHDVGGEG